MLAVLVLLGLATEQYHGLGTAWVHAAAGDIVYAAFWFYVVRLFSPWLALWRTALAIFFYCEGRKPEAHTFTALWLMAAPRRRESGECRA